MRKKYRLSEWMVTGDREYGIDKRFLLLWYRSMCHTKVVRHSGFGTSHSREILTFKNRFAAEMEIDRLKIGENPIQRRYYVNGRLVGESRYKK